MFKMNTSVIIGSNPNKLISGKEIIRFLIKYDNPCKLNNPLYYLMYS